MTHTTAEPRRFSVHARHIDRHHARIVTEPTFEAAAIAYAEDCPFGFEGDDAMSIIVRDIDSGHEHAFRVDLGTGRPMPQR